MKTAAAIKIKIETTGNANDNQERNEIELLAHYREIARQAHEACSSVDMEEFEKKYGLSTFA